jgi:1-acyl-sn-glycerol-3-phosphate acyltransferase
VLPPWWIRRVLLVPTMLVVSLAAVITLPLTVVLAVVIGLLTPAAWGRPKAWTRPVRLLLLVVGYLAAEAVALIVLGVLWLIAGFGRTIRGPASERRHYVLVHRFLEWLYWLVTHVLHLRVRVDGPAPEAYDNRPLIVFCRHAGPGDSFLIVHALLDWYEREPRIVLKDTLQWDPAIDIVLNRLPNRFIRSGSPGRPTADQPGRPPVEQVIGQLARRLDGNDALVLFPEGGNFTARRRVRAIQRLRHKGLAEEVRKAEAMRHVLPPRPAGVLAVLANAGDADVVWVGHTGTDDLLSVADIWAALPMDTEILMRWWHVPASSVPPEPEAQISWLYAWWKQIDDWIAVNRPTR